LWNHPLTSSYTDKQQAEEIALSVLSIRISSLRVVKIAKSMKATVKEPRG
jgi:hypothetical protein